MNELRDEREAVRVTETPRVGAGGVDRRAVLGSLVLCAEALERAHRMLLREGA